MTHLLLKLIARGVLLTVLFVGAVAALLLLCGRPSEAHVYAEPVAPIVVESCCPVPDVAPEPTEVPETIVEAESCVREPIGHRQARRLLDRALTRMLGRNATLAELQTTQAIAWFESHYGAAWAGDGCGSHNWGAIHAPCGESSFLATDSIGDTGEEYPACFRRYGSAQAGAGGLAWQLVRRDVVFDAVATGRLSAVVDALRETEYCHASAATYRAGLERALGAITRALDEPVAFEDVLP